MKASAELRTVTRIEEQTVTEMKPVKVKKQVSVSVPMVSLMITEYQARVLRTLLGSIIGFDSPNGVRVAGDEIFNALSNVGFNKRELDIEAVYEQHARVKSEGN